MLLNCELNVIKTRGGRTFFKKGIAVLVPGDIGGLRRLCVGVCRRRRRQLQRQRQRREQNDIRNVFGYHFRRFLLRCISCPIYSDFSRPKLQ